MIPIFRKAVRLLFPLSEIRVSLAILSTASLSAQQLDQDGDGHSDLWQLRHGIPSGNGDLDTDGDGRSDKMEEVAGTNPRAVDSFFDISTYVLANLPDGGRVARIEIQALEGKTYQIAQADDLQRRIEPLGSPVLSRVNGSMMLEASVDEGKSRSFFRVIVGDQDLDEDGLSAYEEALIGTSDNSPRSSGHPGGDAGAAIDWFTDHHPGYDPAGPQANLREVDVAWVRTTTGGEGKVVSGDLVSIAGTGLYHQLTSWRVESKNGNPSELANTQPIDGNTPQIEGFEFQRNNQPARFATGRIRTESKNLVISSRALTEDGKFLHFQSVGWGSHIGHQVMNYSMDSRGFVDEFGVTHYVIVTPVFTRNDKFGLEMRIVTWRLNALSGALTGVDESGEIELAHLTANLKEAHSSVAHLRDNRWQVTYIGSSDVVRHVTIETDNLGNITSVSRSQFLADEIDGNGSLIVNSPDVGVVGLASDGYLTASKRIGEDFVLTTWEGRKPEDDSAFLDLRRITDSGQDLTPDSAGVDLPLPELRDSFIDEGTDNNFVGNALAVGDFDGDGFDDIAIGAEGRDMDGVDRAGVVYIKHGNPAGMTDPDYDQVWSQASPGIASDPGNEDRFGNALASGDFDGDGYDDLAIGAFFERVDNHIVAGAVHVLYGSPNGLSSLGSQFFTQDSIGLESNGLERFGSALAAGDFDGNGRDDLAISSPGEDIGGQNKAGMVVVLWGADSNEGLVTKNFFIAHQNVSGFYDQAEENDEFGLSLATGDFDGDDLDDLAIGVPGESVRDQVEAGAVQIVYGDGSDGFGFDVFVTQNGFSNGEDILDEAEANDHFGKALAAGDFDGDGADDLAIGVPDEDLAGDEDAGAVNVIYGTFLGINWIGNQLIDQDGYHRISLPASRWNAADEEMGAALVAGDFDGDGFDELVVGAPKEDIGNNTDAGSLTVIKGSEEGLSSTGVMTIDSNSSSNEEGDDLEVAGFSESNDLLGRAFGAGDFDNDGSVDLATGVPFENGDEDQTNVGAVLFLRGSDVHCLSLRGNLQWLPAVRDLVRAALSDLKREQSVGPKAGMLYARNETIEYRHIASCTKLMTLLLAVEAVEAGQAAMTDMVRVSSLAANTGGSKLDIFLGDNSLTEFQDINGDRVPLLQTGDRYPLRLLLAGMMNQSCNKSSVAIGEHIAEQVRGESRDFVIMMNQRAAQLGMTESVFGHPAGGCATKPQDFITLQAECLKHPLVIEMAGIEIYRSAEYPAAVFCGIDALGFPRCTGAFPKFSTIGAYTGRLAWKGGNIGLWFGSNEANQVPPRPDVPWSTNAALGIVERLDRTLAISLFQTGSRSSDSGRLFDYGYRKIFTPDRRAKRDFPEPGGIVGQNGAIRVTNFAIDRYPAAPAVTAVIDDLKELRINIWGLEPDSGEITALGNASRDFALTSLKSDLIQPYSMPNLIDMHGQSKGSGIVDVFTARVEGQHLELMLWRVGDVF